jgi:hypothetical protein
MPLGTVHDVVARPHRHSQVVSADAVPFTALGSFLDFLEMLSLDDWLAVGASSTEPLVAPRGHVAAALLEATLTNQRLEFDAWLVRDAVETVAFLACLPSAPLPVQAARRMAAARSAAERAALAVLARAWLPTSDVEELILPFAACLAKL